MAIVYVTRRVQFNSAHRLHNPAKSDSWNKETYGKCNSPNWHGHNFILEVTVAGEPNTETGYVIDLGDLKNLVEEKVISKVDHANLNLDVDFMQGVIPSTENFAIGIWNQLAGSLSGGTLHSVKLAETENNSVVYLGESD